MFRGGPRAPGKAPGRDKGGVPPATVCGGRPRGPRGGQGGVPPGYGMRGTPPRPPGGPLMATMLFTGRGGPVPSRPVPSRAFVGACRRFWRTRGGGRGRPRGMGATPGTVDPVGGMRGGAALNLPA